MDAARWAKEAGFDAVDVKNCYRYLRIRVLKRCPEKRGKFGGSYENRTRLIKEVIARIKKRQE